MSTPQMDSKEFRNALGQFATGVTVITTLDKEGNKAGMTVNSFSSVSLEPMLVLWSLAKTAKTFDAFNQTERFAIHVLNADQQAISNQFSSRGGDRFENIPLTEGQGGIPVLQDYSVVFQCEIEARYEGGDHIIMVGRVVDFDNKCQPPLIFHAGQYADLDLPVAV
jgi:flavin reductase (DIM6/NTAB) family NADH-FMN oxidoreductase RutF